MSSVEMIIKYYVNIENYKHVFLSETRSCLLENTEGTRKYILHQFSTKLTRALFAGYSQIFLFDKKKRTMSIDICDQARRKGTPREIWL